MPSALSTLFESKNGIKIQDEDLHRGRTRRVSAWSETKNILKPISEKSIRPTRGTNTGVIPFINNITTSHPHTRTKCIAKHSH